MQKIMYQFKKARYEDGAWKLELNGISLIVDGFEIKKDKHYLVNPCKAIAFFSFHNHIYGVSNQLRTIYTAEDLYDTMCGQYAYFNNNSKPGSSNDRLKRAS